MAPGIDLFDALRRARAETGAKRCRPCWPSICRGRLAQWVVETEGLTGNLADTPDKTLRKVASAVNAWRVKPVGSEGYRTAEVTFGGVDTRRWTSAL